MKLELINDTERILKLESKSIKLKWCTDHKLFEGECNFEDLKGAKGIDFPFGVLINAFQTGDIIFPLYDMVLVSKEIDERKTPWIFVHYVICPEFETNQEMRNKLFHRLAINPEKQLIKKCQRYYLRVEIESDMIQFSSFVDLNEDIYEALIRDAKFNKKELL
ncbi:MAG TPA: hypothetical protein PK263_05210 [bacterium]|nr:hypothetical protein [bacterium]